MVNGKCEMVNARCEMKSYYKYELAEAAGVSTRTFGRWLRQQSEQLSEWGVTPRTQMLPPVAVKLDLQSIRNRPFNLRLKR